MEESHAVGNFPYRLLILKGVWKERLLVIGISEPSSIEIDALLGYRWHRRCVRVVNPSSQGTCCVLLNGFGS